MQNSVLRAAESGERKKSVWNVEGDEFQSPSLSINNNKSVRGVRINAFEFSGELCFYDRPAKFDEG